MFESWSERTCTNQVSANVSQTVRPTHVQLGGACWVFRLWPDESTALFLHFAVCFELRSWV